MDIEKFDAGLVSAITYRLITESPEHGNDQVVFRTTVSDFCDFGENATFIAKKFGQAIDKEACWTVISGLVFLSFQS